MIEKHFDRSVAYACTSFRLSKGGIPTIFIGDLVLQDILTDVHFEKNELGKVYKNNEYVFSFNGYDVLYQDDEEYIGLGRDPRVL